MQAFRRGSRVGGPVGPAAAFAMVAVLAGALSGCDNGDGCGCGAFVDTVAPAAVTTLAVTSGQPCVGYFTLSWTATGDDGSTGTATEYDLRFNQTGFATAADWEQAVAITGLPAPRATGQAEVVEIHGLTAGNTYHFALLVCDEVDNWSDLSNVASAVLCAPDTIRPAMVTDLRIDPAAATTTSLRLLWTAVGDDSLTGPAAAYDVRYNTTGIAGQADWEAATPLTGLPAPRTPGEPESLTVSGLAPETTYYFALEVVDDATLRSARSSAIAGTTPAGTRRRVAAGGGGDFTRIQPAIDAAANHDTISVAPGVYGDTLRIAGKTLFLVGDGADVCTVSHPTQEEIVLTVTDAADVHIRGLAFTQHLTLCSNGIRIESANVVFERCVLYHCGLTSVDSDLELRECTLDGQCQTLCDTFIPSISLSDGDTQFENCILAAATGGNAQLACTIATPVSFKCCDVLLELVGCTDPVGTDGNFELDPLYRDAAAGDFRLQIGSPCLPEGSSGCGLVGALGTE